MHDKKFGVKVLIGIVLGAIVGFALLNFMPVGIQPGDTLTATLTDGSPLEVKVPDGKGEVQLEVDEQPVGDPVEIRGKPLGDAPEILSDTLGITVTDVEVTSRGEVKDRPAITEILYITGQIFMRLLKMIVIPLVIVTVLVGIASLGDLKKLGSLGWRTAVVYVSTMFVAVLIGVTFVNTIKPGAALASQWADEAGGAAIADQTAADLILKTIPTNPIESIASGDIVGILFFVIFMAIAMLAIGKHKIAPVFNFFEAMNDLIFVMVGWVMKLAPIGVGALLAHTIATQDIGFIGGLLESLGKFAGTVVLALLTHLIVLLLIVRFIAKYSPIEFLRKMSPAMATAFGTNSSSATMPVTLKCVESMGVSKRIRNFVVPVGATLNMDGTALFEATTVLFFAQAFGYDFGFGQQMTVAFVSVIAAIGAAGIPSAGLVTMVLVLSAVGLPTSKLALIWGIDRPLDMCRTIVNITGDAMTSRVIQTWYPDIRIEDDDLASEYEDVEPEASHGD